MDFDDSNNDPDKMNSTPSPASNSSFPRINISSVSSSSQSRQGKVYSSPIIPIENLSPNYENETLHVAHHRAEITKVHNSSKLMVFEGDTGCGKSSQIPQYILEDCAYRQIPCRILVVTPRQICAVAAAERVCLERDETLGTSVGYQISLESKISPTSNLIYTSTEFILRKFTIQEPNVYLKEITTLIIDEFQERDALTDLFMLCVRELCSKENLKIVILTSKDSDKIAAYFGECDVYKIHDSDEIKKEITEVFLDDILKLDEFHFTAEKLKEYRQNFDNNLKSFESHLVEEYNKQHGNSIDLNLISKLVNHLHLSSEKSSTILVFLPGFNEILLLANKLFSILDANCEIVSLHNEMQSSDQAKVFATLPDTVRKIVLATNLAESLLTINNVQYVIDTGREHIEYFDSKTRITNSCMQWITKTSSLQRKSRVTRSIDGAIFRLYSRDCFNCLSNEMRLEILECDATKICLLVKSLVKTESIEDFLYKAITPPTATSINRSTKFLQQIGALDPDETMTQLGRNLVSIPLNVHHAKMILYGIFFKCIDPILTIVSILSLECPFVLPRDENDRAKIAEIKAQLVDGSFSDIFVMLKIFQNWNEYKSTKTFDCIFCEKNFVSAGTLELIALNRVRLVGHLRSLKLIQSVGSIALLNEQSNNWSVLKACITAGAYPNVARFDNKMITETDKIVQIADDSVVKVEDFKQHPLCWMIFEKKINSHNPQLKTCTIISNFCLALMTAMPDLYFKSEISSSNPTEILFNIAINNFIRMTGSEETGRIIFTLRERLNILFNKFLLDVEKFYLEGQDFYLHEMIVTMLKIEDENMKLKSEYKEIGSRPRIVTRDYDTSATTSFNDSSSMNDTTSSSFRKATKQIYF